MVDLPDRLWRVFPWDPDAAAGEPFSASYLSAAQGSGRFDLPGSTVLYLAEDPEHAVAEKIQRYRGQTIDAADLEEFGQPLALVSVRLPAGLADSIADLCDPAILLRHELSPGDVAAHSVAITQRIAALLDREGYAGLRWWSAFRGEWRGVALFTERLGRARLRFDAPEALTLDHPAVIEAATALGIRLQP